MKRLAISFILLTSAAFGQSSNNWTTGYVPPASEWNSLFASKQNYNAPGVFTTISTTGNATVGGALTVGTLSVAPNLSATSASIGGSALAAGACASGTATVANSTTSMVIAVSPQTFPGAGFTWQGYVSAAGTVTVEVCAVVAATPTASLYNVRVVQ